MQGRRYIVSELTLVFKYQFANVDRRDMERVNRAIGRWARPAKHTPYTVSLVVVSDETAMELMARVASDLDDISSIENYFCQAVSIDAIGRHGLADPFRSRVLDAWAEVGRRIKPKHLTKGRPWYPRDKEGFKKLDPEASVKMRLSLPRKREPLTDSDRPKR